jgi:diguanylate cyclase (GGDEF)-like protein
MYLPEMHANHRIPRDQGIAAIAALAVPVVCAWLFPESRPAMGTILWLMALAPVIVFAYHKGRVGAWWGLAIGLLVLAVTEIVLSRLGGATPVAIVPAGVAAYAAIGLGISQIAQGLHRKVEGAEELALKDMLTGLPNRRHASLILNSEFLAAKRGRVLSVVLFDIDHFKRYNDTFGHRAGDEALKHFAQILFRTTRKMNLSARFGGEEFISVLADTDDEGGLKFIARVRTALSEEPHGDPPITVSAGVAKYIAAMATPEDLIAAADEALYEAKRSGRNCGRIYKPKEAGDADQSSKPALKGTRTGGATLAGT